MFNRGQVSVYRGFQSLFCWKFLLGKSLSGRTSSLRPVSILVLLEVPLRPRRVLHSPGYNRVSILVLLEVPLRQGWSDESDSPYGCFNPCFVGSSSQAHLLPPPFLINQQFQSLFCWKFLLGVDNTISRCWRDVFQSLFCWKFLLGICFGKILHEMNIMFQSLFCWKFLLGRSNGSPRMALVNRFNPCFVGSSSQARNLSESDVSTYKFQSLFCWKFLLGVCRGPCDRRSHEVSILVLLEVPLRLFPSVL